MGKNIDYINEFGKSTTISIAYSKKFKTLREYLDYIKGIEKSNDDKRGHIIKNLEKRKMFVEKYKYFTDGIFNYCIESIFIKDEIDCVHIRGYNKRINFIDSTFSTNYKSYRYHEIDDMIENKSIVPINEEEYNKVDKLFANTYSRVDTIRSLYEKSYSEPKNPSHIKNESIKYCIEISEENLDRNLNDLINERYNELLINYENNLINAINKWIAIRLENDINLYIIKVSDVKNGIVSYSKGICINSNFFEINMMKSSSFIKVSHFRTFRKDENNEFDEIYNSLYNFHLETKKGE